MSVKAVFKNSADTGCFKTAKILSSSKPLKPNFLEDERKVFKTLKLDVPPAYKSDAAVNISKFNYCEKSLWVSLR